MGGPNRAQQFPVPEPLSFCLGPLRDTHPFSLLPLTSHLLGQAFSGKYQARIFFSQKGEFTLNLTAVLKVKDPLVSFISSFSDGTGAESADTGYLSLLEELLSPL